jgi:hypothetical protein
MANKIISRFLDTAGDGSGTKNANGNYASAAEEFLITPDSGEQWWITRMIVSITDTAGMLQNEYGNLGAALTNGIAVDVQDDSGVLYSLTDEDVPVKTNAQWGAYCFDVALFSWGTSPTNEELVVRWTFAKSGKPVQLRSWQGEKLVVTLNDDLTGLLTHRFLVQGYESENI